MNLFRITLKINSFEMLNDLIEEWAFCFEKHHSANSSWSLKIWMGEIENNEIVAKLLAGLWICLILLYHTCWPKYLGVTCWHFCWHLESLTSWDGLLSPLFPCRYDASAANIVKSHGKSHCSCQKRNKIWDTWIVSMKLTNRYVCISYVKIAQHGKYDR